MQYGERIYGIASYGSVFVKDIIQDHYIDIMQYLPPYYQNAKEVEDLQESLGYEVGRLRYALEETLNQCSISSSTWGLDRWEKLFGIQTDRSKPYTHRREVLMAKLRGSGTTTKEMIKNVAIAFSGGEVDIQEFADQYRFVIHFIGVRGIPQNMAGLIAALDEIKPAHLTYSFRYTYTVWQQIKMTWQDASQKTWGDLRVYEGE